MAPNTSAILTALVLAFASAIPSQDAQQRSTMRKVWEALLAGDVPKDVFASDFKFECPQKCAEVDWCPCDQTHFITTSFKKHFIWKAIEPEVFFDKDGKTAYARYNLDVLDKRTGKQSPLKHLVDIFTFDNSGMISKVQPMLPNKYTADQNKMFKQIFDGLLKGGDAMKYFAKNATLFCSQSCVDVDWCMCDQTKYDYAGITEKMKSLPKEIMQRKDVTINGQKLTYDFMSPQLRLYRKVGNTSTVFFPYTAAGTYKGVQIPPTPLIEIYTFNDANKITEVDALTGIRVKMPNNAGGGGGGKRAGLRRLWNRMGVDLDSKSLRSLTGLVRFEPRKYGTIPAIR